MYKIKKSLKFCKKKKSAYFTFSLPYCDIYSYQYQFIELLVQNCPSFSCGPVEKMNCPSLIESVTITAVTKIEHMRDPFWWTLLDAQTISLQFQVLDTLWMLQSHQMLTLRRIIAEYVMCGRKKEQIRWFSHFWKRISWWKESSKDILLSEVLVSSFQNRKMYCLQNYFLPV